ncbi:hypothetical protein INR49_014405, partial [Caranx melampygus]
MPRTGSHKVMLIEGCRRAPHRRDRQTHWRLSFLSWLSTECGVCSQVMAETLILFLVAWSCGQSSLAPAVLDGIKPAVQTAEKRGGEADEDESRKNNREKVRIVQRKERRKEMWWK